MNGRPVSATDWETTLTVFEARVEAQWTAHREGSLDPVPMFEPPAAASPLPAHLVTRATELVWRCRALEEALTAALADATAQLARLDETDAATSAPAEPVFFDSRV